MAQDTKQGDWMKGPQNLANIGHFLGSLSILLVVVLFSHKWYAIGIVETLLVSYVFIKEYWYDLRYETAETIWSSTVDALGYLAGTIVGWILLLVAHLIGSW